MSVPNAMRDPRSVVSVEFASGAVAAEPLS